jgi:hypothetical protein
MVSQFVEDPWIVFTLLFNVPYGAAWYIVGYALLVSARLLLLIFKSRSSTFLLSTIQQSRGALWLRIEDASRVAMTQPGPIRTGLGIIKGTAWFWFNTNVAHYFAKISSTYLESVKRALWKSIVVIQRLVTLCKTLLRRKLKPEDKLPSGLWFLLFMVLAVPLWSMYLLEVYPAWKACWWEILVLPHLREQENRQNNNSRIYTALRHGSRQIRLIRLLPAQFTDPIEAILHVGTWDTSKYEALSYSWGNTNLKKTIKVNGRVFFVTKNLYKALRYLRNETTARYLWVDAICIDQKDVEDTNQQVRQMYQIYASAEKVIVWLGIATVGFQQVFECTGRRVPQAFGYSRAISKVLCAAWWERIWVVQELVAAKMVTVQCSEHTVSWEVFCQVIDDFITEQQTSNDLPGLEEYRTCRRLRDARLLRIPPKFGLLSLVYDFRRRKAKDPRDKLFALHGLLENSEPALITPDYSRGKDALFGEFARNCINQFRSLSIIAISECGAKFKPFSWFPSWTGSSDDFPRRPFWNGDLVTEERKPLWQRKFSAAGNHPASTCTIPTFPDFAIKAEGFVYDIVTVIGLSLDLYLEGSLLSSDSQPILKTLQPVITLSLSSLDWKVLLTHWESLAEDARKKYSIATRNAYHLTVTAGVFDSYPDGPDEKNYLVIRGEICEGRNFFVTKRGVFGLGPAEVQPGDEVCVLLGSPVPMILRPEGVPRQYIGQAYVHDIMEYKGDITRDIAEEKLVLDEFIVV